MIDLSASSFLFSILALWRILSNTISSGIIIEITLFTASFFSASIWSRISACGMVLGKPSKMKPAASWLLAISFLIIATTMESSTKLPLSISCLAILPSSVSAAISFLRRSPVETWWKLYFSTINLVSITNCIFHF